MKRFFLIFCIAFFSALIVYLSTDNSFFSPLEEKREVIKNQEEFFIEISSSFDTRPDPFSLEDEKEGLYIYENALLLKHIRYFKASDSPFLLKIKAGSALSEFRISATHNRKDSNPKVLKARILKDCLVLKEASVWSNEEDTELFLSLPHK